MLILEILEAQVDTSGEEPDEEVQVEEKRGPGGRLVLRDGSNDGNVNLGIAGIPQRVETSAPGSNVAQRSEGDETQQTQAKRCHEDGDEEGLELTARNGRPHVLDEANELDETKDAYKSDVSDPRSSWLL